MNQNRIKTIALYTLVLLALLWGLSVFSGGRQDRISYSSVLACFRQEQVASFVVDGGGTLSVALQDGTVRRHDLADVDSFRRELGPLIEEQYQRIQRDGLDPVLIQNGRSLRRGRAAYC